MKILYAAIYRIVEKLDVIAPPACAAIEQNRLVLHLFESSATAAIKIAERISDEYHSLLSAREVHMHNVGTCCSGKEDGDMMDALAHPDDRVNPSVPIPPPHSDVMKEMVEFFIVKSIEGRSSPREFRRRQIHDVGNSVTYHLLLNGKGIGIGVAVARPNNTGNADLEVIRFTEQLLFDISGFADGQQFTTASLVTKSSFLFSTKRNGEDTEKAEHKCSQNANSGVRVLSLLASSFSEENLRKDSLCAPSEASGDLPLGRGEIFPSECGASAARDSHVALIYIEEQLRRNVEWQNNQQLNVNLNNLQPARSRPYYGGMRGSNVPLQGHDQEQSLTALADIFTEVAH